MRDNLPPVPFYIIKNEKVRTTCILNSRLSLIVGCRLINRTPQQVNPSQQVYTVKLHPFIAAMIYGLRMHVVFFTMVLKSCQDRGKPTRGYEDHVSLACGCGSLLTRDYLKLDLMSVI